MLFLLWIPITNELRLWTRPDFHEGQKLEQALPHLHTQRKHTSNFGIVYILLRRH